MPNSNLDNKGYIDIIAEFTGTTSTVVNTVELMQYRQIMLVLVNNENNRLACNVYPMGTFVQICSIHYVYHSDSIWGTAQCISRTQIRLNRTASSTSMLIVYGIK